MGSLKAKGSTKYYQGMYQPLNPKKYLGDPTKIRYMSNWEFQVMQQFDISKGVLAWGSEEVVIPYFSPVDNKWHRYFVDFIVISYDNKGKKSVVLIEVKPYKEQFPPKKQGKKKSRYLQECKTYTVNQAKWKYARQYCEERDWTFIILTEKEILGKK